MDTRSHNNERNHQLVRALYMACIDSVLSFLVLLFGAQIKMNIFNVCIINEKNKERILAVEILKEVLWSKQGT